MKAERSALVKLFDELGVKGAAEWSPKRMSKKIETLAKLSEDEQETKTEESGKLLKDILKALEDEEDVEVVGEETDEEPETAEENGDAKESKKSSKKKGKKGAAVKSAAKDGKPGVIASIVEFLTEATEEKPLTKKQLLAKLTKRFPDRPAEHMTTTINAQVPNRLKGEKKLNVKSKKEEGKETVFWIAGGKAKSKEKETAASE